MLSSPPSSHGLESHRLVIDGGSSYDSLAHRYDMEEPLKALELDRFQQKRKKNKKGVMFSETALLRKPKSETTVSAFKCTTGQVGRVRKMTRRRPKSKTSFHTKYKKSLDGGVSVDVITKDKMPVTLALHSDFGYMDKLVKDAQSHKKLLKKARARLNLEHGRAVKEYWEHLHNRRIPFPEVKFIPETIKKHIHSDTILHIVKHHQLHDEFIKKAKSSINNRLRKNVKEERARKNKSREKIVARATGKSAKLPSKRSVFKSSKNLLNRTGTPGKHAGMTPVYRGDRMKRNKLYDDHILNRSVQRSSSARFRGTSLIMPSGKTKSGKRTRRPRSASSRLSPGRTGVLSQTDLQLILNRNNVNSPPKRRGKRPSSAPMKRQTSSSSAVSEAVSTQRSLSGKSEDRQKFKAPNNTPKKPSGGSVPLLSTSSSVVRSIRKNLTKIVAEDIVERHAPEYQHLLKYLNDKKLHEMAKQEIEEDANDYILSTRPDKVPYLNMESQGSLMDETKEDYNY